MGDLEGLLVIAVEQAVAAPYCTAKLADAGARVIKVERPEGDFARRYDRDVQGQSAYFVWLNRGKESVRVDLDDAADRALLGRMVARADVLVQNLKPGVLARFGFGSDELRARHRHLVTCDITGYGPDGPLAHLKAYDLLVQGESGLAAITGTADGPARVGVSVADIVCGAHAFAAILQALLARQRTGQGRGIQASLFHGLADWMNVPDLQYRYGERPALRLGLHHPTIAPYGAYGCGDGAAVLFAIQNEAEWQRLCAQVLDQPGLAADPRFYDNPARVAHRAALDAIILQVFAAYGRAEVIARLDRAGIAYGRLASQADLLAHPQRREVEVATPAGPVTLMAPGAWVPEEPFEPGPVPALGEHDAAIRSEFA